MSLRTLRWLTAVLPIAVLAALDYVRHVVFPAFLHTTTGFLFTYVALLLGVVIFSELVFRSIARMQTAIVEQNRKLTTLYAEGRRQAQQLKALHEAGRAITAELELETVLRKVVDLSQELVGARYGALKVLEEEGYVGRFLTSGIDEETVKRIGRFPEGRGVVGVVRQTGKPLRLADISTHPASSGFPPHHPPMKTFMGVPIVSRNVVIGNLYLTEKRDGDEFTQEDEDAVVMLAAQAAIAIENARLYEQEQILAVLEERERIAQDLHDGIIQSLYAIGLNLEKSVERAEAFPGEIPARLTRALDGLNGVMWDVRNYIFGLEKRKGQSLHEALASMAAEFRVNTLIDADVAVEGDVEGLLSPEQVGHVLQIAREALSNVLKHARATSVSIVLAHAHDNLLLTIRDNGTGFDPKTMETTGHGLRNIAERARALQGTLIVGAAPKQGTRIQLTIPLATSKERVV